MSYKERKDAELAALEEAMSAEEGFSGKELTEWEAKVIAECATDQQPGPYSGKKFLPKRGYFACKRCGHAIYLARFKFAH